MPSVNLFQISNRPSGNFPPRRRLLNYEVSRSNAHWWVLRVRIPVRYHFAADEAIWPPTGRRIFKRDFERLARETWSRRHVVQSDDVRTEVRLRIEEDERADPQYLWHIWVLPWQIPGAPTCVNYDFSGAFPRRRRDDGSIEYGERVSHIALAQISAGDVECATDHLSGADAGRSIFRQRGTDHEVGHMLGLQHPGCSGNEGMCYGTGDRQRARIMGVGSWVSQQDYVWAQRIMEHHEPRRTWQLAADRWVGSGRGFDDRSVPVCGLDP